MKQLARKSDLKNVMKYGNEVIQINYENISVRLTVEDFYAMADVVEDLYARIPKKKPDPETDWEGFQIQSRGLNISFSRGDFLSLRELIIAARRGLSIGAALEKRSEASNMLEVFFGEEICSDILC